VVLIVTAVAIGPIAPAFAPARARLQPALAQLAAHSPQGMLAVIVQKAGTSDAAETLATQLGGRITKDLHIINAFAVEMPGAAVLDLAQAESVRWVALDAPTQSTLANDVFTTWATQIGALNSNTFTDAGLIIDSALGPNGTYGSGSNDQASFTGFTEQVNSGYAISKVEIVLNAYVPAALSWGQDPILSVSVGGQAGLPVFLNHHAFDAYAGAANAGTVYVDVTGTRAWHWADFANDLEVVIDQRWFQANQVIDYDAVGLRVTSAPGSDAPGDTGGDTSAATTMDTSQQVDVYDQVIGASQLWNTATKLRGTGVTIAIVDSGIFRTKDLGKRVRANVNFNAAYHNAADRYGHGTFVAGITAGSGSQSGGRYIGVAPRADLLNVRVSDDQGMSSESDVVSGLQWVLDNKARYNIRVVNLSLNSSVAQSYNTSPLDAAVEVLWFNGIVVVVAAGNNGSATLFAPADDPFVITVGATNDAGTASLADDAVASFSAYGTPESGVAKPDLVAPGKNIIGVLPENDKLNMSVTHASNRIDATYFRMSGTSVSAPMVSGAVALLLQDEPALNPDQVKYRLMATANKTWPGYNATTAGAGYLDIYAAVNGSTTQPANAGVTASQLLWTGSSPITWGSVNWNSVNWNSVNWNSVNWNSVNWNSVNWNSDYWGQ
jgi:serine protease AprX